MAKKRKCRLTADELDVHKRAVNLRKMTDEQLVNYVDELHKSERAKETPENGRESVKAVKNPASLETLLKRLAEGCIKGVGKATADKITSYCKEQELI